MLGLQGGRYVRRPILFALILTHALALTLALALGGCGTAGTKLPVSEMTARTNSAGVQVVDVDVHSYYFKPNRIVVKQGVPLDLTVHFKSFFVPHTFTCNEGDAGLAVSLGAGFMSFHRTKHARLTPTQPGEYEFFCHVGKHHQKGMDGTIVVR
jgi:plastocyanin